MKQRGLQRITALILAVWLIAPTARLCFASQGFADSGRADSGAGAVLDSGINASGGDAKSFWAWQKEIGYSGEGVFTLTGDLILTGGGAVAGNYTIDTAGHSLILKGGGFTFWGGRSYNSIINNVGGGAPVFIVEDGASLAGQYASIITKGDTGVELRGGASLNWYGRSMYKIPIIEAAKTAVTAGEGGVMMEKTLIKAPTAVARNGAAGCTELALCEITGGFEAASPVKDGDFALLGCIYAGKPPQGAVTEKLELIISQQSFRAVAPPGCGFEGVLANYTEPADEAALHLYAPFNNSNYGVETAGIVWNSAEYNTGLAAGESCTVSGRADIAEGSGLRRFIDAGAVDGSNADSFTLNILARNKAKISFAVKLIKFNYWGAEVCYAEPVGAREIYAQFSDDNGVGWHTSEALGNAVAEDDGNVTEPLYFYDENRDGIYFDENKSYLFRLILDGSIYEGTSDNFLYTKETGSTGTGDTTGGDRGGGQGEATRGETIVVELVPDEKPPEQKQKQKAPNKNDSPIITAQAGERQEESAVEQPSEGAVETEKAPTQGAEQAEQPAAGEAAPAQAQAPKTSKAPIAAAAGAVALCGAAGAWVFIKGKP